MAADARNRLASELSDWETMPDPGRSFVLGQHDRNTLAQLADVAARAERVALMADGHLGYIMPVGGVAAYRRKISVAGVGFDIACGNCAIRTDLVAADLPREELEAAADRIQREISFGVGRTNRAGDAPDDHPLFDDEAWAAVPAPVAAREKLRSLAREQLGTVGSGNHYVDLFADEEERIWVGVHFGSRGLGHTIASGFMSIASGKRWGERVPETEALFDLGSDEGDRYWSLMELAGRYAYAGREWVCRKVARDILGGEEIELVHNHHNFAWKERHFGEEGIVVRKGATPAFPGQLGFVGASMTGTSVILRGADTATDAQRASMFSTVHGAGRVMSRSEAAGKRHRFGPKAGQLVRDAEGRPVRPGKVSEDEMKRAVKAAGVVLRGAGPDESPFVYRNLDEVLALQPGIEIVHRLRPLAVVMAGADELDPYKD
jgi:tRNA-splicing ligase RtcB